MIILGIETATSICSVALADEERVLAELWFSVKNIHDRVLAEGISFLTKQIALPLTKIDAIAVSVGPGSFTGLRIGMAVAKGLAFASQKPMIAVGTLLAQACAALAFVRNMGEVIVPVIRSRQGEIYCAKFRLEDGLPVQQTPELMMALASFPAWLKEPALICGDGVPMLRAAGILNSLPTCFLAPEDSARLRGGVIASLGHVKLARGEVVSAEALAPLYVQEFDVGAR